jgi:sporulation protein YlmC with PRC-barrel domain
MRDAERQPSMADRHASDIRGLPVIIPDGRLLGTVHDAVIDVNEWSCTHIFVSDPPEGLVEGRTHVAIPWNWVRSIGDVVVLRWFPPTPIPRNP